MRAERSLDHYVTLTQVKEKYGIVNVQWHRWNAPTFAQMDRTCCWPAPITSLQSRNVTSKEIHTFEPEMFRDLFPDTVLLTDVNPHRV